MLDLVSNDVQRVEGVAVDWFFWGILAFFDIAVGSPLLIYFIGWQSVMGIIFLYFLSSYFAGLSYAAATFRLRTAVVSDRRISLMNQVIYGIRAIKTHAWEDQYREKIGNTRRYEQLQLRMSYSCFVVSK